MSSNNVQVLRVTAALDNMESVPAGRILSGKGGIFPLTADQMENICILRSAGTDYFFVTEQVASTAALVTLISKFRGDRSIKSKDVQKVVATVRLISRIYLREETRKENTKGQDASEAEILISEIVTRSHELKASDIHIESRAAGADVLMRVNGKRSLEMKMTTQQAFAVGNCMYSFYADPGSKDQSWDPATVQDGQLSWKADDGTPYQLRFSSSPIYPDAGFQIVLRAICASPSAALDIKRLGYSDDMLQMLDAILSASSGIVLLVGATNSGKSTTIGAMIREIYIKHGPMIKVITVEDPVETEFPGACQISVPRRKNDDLSDPSNTPFTKFLRGSLRQDPDIAMVGEIRDAASASIVKDFVLAGRKLLSTLHAFSTFGAFMRLREMAVPWDILTMPGFISGIIYQRLVPTNCPHCSVPIKQAIAESPGLFSEPFLQRLKSVCNPDVDDIRVTGPGCSHCKEGVAGRTVCAEFNIPSKSVLKLLAANDSNGAKEKWREEGGKTALDHAIEKMKKGLLCPTKVEYNISLLTKES